MNAGLYIAMNGANYNMFAQSVHANNLANASTSGFKAELVNALSARVVGDDGLEHGELPLALATSIDFSFGSMQETGDDFDIAIDGQGWMSVLTDDGQEAYTRGGRLMIDELGFLRNERGNQILGGGGPIVIPESEKVEIANDGTISVRGLGQAASQLQQVDVLRLVNPPINTISRGPDGLFYLEGDAPAAADPLVRLRSGFVETSNVNPVHELTSITSSARQFEMNIKMMQAMGDITETTTRLLQVQV